MLLVLSPHSKPSIYLMCYYSFYFKTFYIVHFPIIEQSNEQTSHWTKYSSLLTLCSTFFFTTVWFSSMLLIVWNPTAMQQEVVENPFGYLKSLCSPSFLIYSCGSFLLCFYQKKRQTLKFYFRPENVPWLFWLNPTHQHNFSSLFLFSSISVLLSDPLFPVFLQVFLEKTLIPCYIWQICKLFIVVSFWGLFSDIAACCHHHYECKYN